MRHYVFYRLYRLRYALVLKSATPLINNIADGIVTCVRTERSSHWMSQRDKVETVNRQILHIGRYGRIAEDSARLQDTPTPHDISLDAVKAAKYRLKRLPDVIEVVP